MAFSLQQKLDLGTITTRGRNPADTSISTQHCRTHENRSRGSDTLETALFTPPSSSLLSRYLQTQFISFEERMSDSLSS